MRRFQKLLVLVAITVPGVAGTQSATARLYGFGFEPVRGGHHSDVEYFAHGSASNLHITPNGVALYSFSRTAGKPSTGVVRMTILGGNPSARGHARTELPGRIYRFVGAHPDKWQQNIPTYETVTYSDVYRGIDIVYRHDAGLLEYEFLVRPGADPSHIGLKFSGGRSLTLDSDGKLVLQTAAGSYVTHKPFVYQNYGADRRQVPARFKITRTGKVRFDIAPYDRTRALIIDPTLTFTALVGGSGGEDARGVGVDAAGNVYIAGTTSSVDFPTVNTPQPTFTGSSAIFVVKLSPLGTPLFATFIAPSAEGNVADMAVTPTGNVFITGNTSSPNFPTLNAFQPTWRGNDAFVARLNSTGSLVYSTYLGGTGNDEGNGIAVDSAGNAYVTGKTQSRDFPGTPGSSMIFGASDIFVAKLAPAGNTLVYARYIIGGDGGPGAFANSGNGIAVDIAGNAYVTGSTKAPNFPTTIGAFDTSCGTDGACNPTFIPLVGTLTFPDAFVLKLDPSGTTLVYSTFIGGSSGDGGYGIAVDSAGNAYVTGKTASPDFLIVGGFQPTSTGDDKGFVAKLNSTGTALVYSTYLASDGFVSPARIAVDGSANAYVAGVTASSTLYLANPVQSTLAGTDAFVTKINASGTNVPFSTYLGGSNADSATAIAVDAAHKIYIAGTTYSADFPGVLPGSALGGSIDSFVTKLSLEGLALTKTASADTVFAGADLTYNLRATNLGLTPATGVTITDTLPAGVSLVSVSPSQGSCTGTAVVVCILGSLAGEASGSVSIVVRPSIPGTITNTATVQGNEADPNPGDNMATVSTTVATAADLAVTAASASSSADPSSDLTFTVTVTNLGPGTATGVVLTDTISPGATLMSAGTPQGSCTTTTTITCALGSLPPLASVTVTVVVSPRVGGELRSTAEVHGNERDLVPANNTAVLTLPCPNCPEIGIAAIEVTQGIQSIQEASRVNLIWGKSALVRVYLQVDDPAILGYSNEVTGELITYRCGQSNPIINPNAMLPFPLKPLNAPVSFFPKTVALQREKLTYTLNFMVTPGSTGLCTDFEVKLTSAATTGKRVRNTLRSTGWHFDLASAAAIRLFNYVWPNIDPPDVSKKAAFHDFVQRFFPISDLHWQEAIFDAAPLADAGEVPTFCAHIILMLTTTRWNNLVWGEDPRLRYYVMTNTAQLGPRRGTTLGGPIGCGPDGDTYSAHELAHTFGLQHTFTGNGEDCPFAGVSWCPTDPYPYPGGFLGPDALNLWGVDLRGGSSAKLYPPLKTYDLMAYGPSGAVTWLSDYNYKRLKTILDNEGLAGTSKVQTQAASSVLAANLSEHLAVLGTIDPSQGTVQLSTFYRMPNMLPVQPRIPGPYTIRLLDRAGTTLADYPFTPHTALHQAGANAPLQAISELVPYNANTAKIAILYNNVEVAAKPVSANAPVVSVTSPAVQGVLQGSTAHLQWTATDADGDPLVFQVLYSTDGGFTGTLMGGDLTGTQVDLPIDRLPGTNRGQFIIVASDGVNTGRAITAEFIVPSKGPSVAISPNGPVTVNAGEILSLGGSAFDPEDGAIGEDKMEWRSDRDGLIGLGSTLLNGFLSAGVHHITFSATDGDGNTGAATITVTVLPGNRSPVANAGPDQTVECAGPSGTTVALNGAASSDPDGDPLTYAWTGPFGTRYGVSATVTLPLGTHHITLTVNDGKGGVATDETIITVRDTQPPTLSMSLSPNLLWPPNHALMPITATIRASDVCQGTPSVRLVSIKSNEPDDSLGDGDTPEDIQSAAFNTDDRTFLLRAERSATGTGRIYTVVYEARDASNNAVTAAATVNVPHDEVKR